MNAFAKALSAALVEYAVVSCQILNDGANIGFVYREAAVFEQDSGLRFFSGEESDEYADNPDNFQMVPLNQMREQFPHIQSLMTKQTGAWDWDEQLGQFVVATDWSPQE